MSRKTLRCSSRGGSKQGGVQRPLPLLLSKAAEEAQGRPAARLSLQVFNPQQAQLQARQQRQQQRWASLSEQLQPLALPWLTAGQGGKSLAQRRLGNGRYRPCRPCLSQRGAARRPLPRAT